jgi:hypothetical protein
MLATALTSSGNDGLAGHHRAVELLQPLIAATEELPRQRLAALVLLALVQRELGEEAGLGRALADLEQLIRSSPDQGVPGLLPEVHQALDPHRNGTEGSQSPSFAIASANRQRLYALARELSLATTSQAA